MSERSEGRRTLVEDCCTDWQGNSMCCPSWGFTNTQRTAWVVGEECSSPHTTLAQSALWAARERAVLLLLADRRRVPERAVRLQVTPSLARPQQQPQKRVPLAPSFPCLPSLAPPFSPSLHSALPLSSATGPIASDRVYCHFQLPLAFQALRCFTTKNNYATIGGFQVRSAVRLNCGFHFTLFMSANLPILVGAHFETRKSKRFQIKKLPFHWDTMMTGAFKSLFGKIRYFPKSVSIRNPEKSTWSV